MREIGAEFKMSARTLGAAGAAGGARNKENTGDNAGTPGKQPSLKQQFVAQCKASSAQKVSGWWGRSLVLGWHVAMRPPRQPRRAAPRRAAPRDQAELC